MLVSNGKRVIAAAALSAATAFIGSIAHAATDTFTPTTTLTGTLAVGASNSQSITYYPFAAGNANFSPTFTVGDDLLFTQASGGYVIVPTTNGLDPSSLTFTGGANYDFTKANTTAGGNTFSGFAAFTVSGTTLGGADSFGSSAITDANATAAITSFALTLGTAGNSNSYTGTLILRQRPVAITNATVTNTINSGTLEIHDGAALTATSQNNPNLTVNGGTFAVNIDNGDVAGTGIGNASPSTSQLNGTLSINGTSTVANNAIDAIGRARNQSIWQGAIAVASGATLTVNTGAGTQFGGASNAALSGTGTILIGTDAATTNANGSAGTNRLRLAGNASAGSATLNWNLGANGIIESAAAASGTTNYGTLAGQTNSLLRGSTSASSATSGASTLSIGAIANSTSTFAGSIINGDTNSGNATYSGAVSVTGANAPTALAAVAARAVMNSNLTKAGATSTLTLTGANVYGGTTNVNAGTLVAQSNTALGTGSGAVTVASGATLDLQATQNAGKAFVLSGGSLVNNGGTAVSIGTGASGNLNSAGANGGSGVFAGGGNTATVAFSAPNVAGGTQATGQILLQLGSLNGTGSAGSSTGSGYVKDPRITFSDPDFSIPGARAARVVALLNTSGAVASISILDPGYGYTSVPTVSIDNTGTGGSGFVPVFTMTGNAIRILNAGSGYTSAPTLSFGGSGYETNAPAIGVGGFGNISLTANSNIGGSGTLALDAPITGTGFGLTKIGAGTTTLSAANTFTGATMVNAGTLATAATGGTLGTGNVTVADIAGATLTLNNATSIADAATLTFGNASVINLAGGPGTTEVLAALVNTTNGMTLNASGVYTAVQLDALLLTTAFSVSSLETITIGSGVSVPEPTSLAVLGIGAIGMTARRRRAI